MARCSCEEASRQSCSSLSGQNDLAGLLHEVEIVQVSRDAEADGEGVCGASGDDAQGLPGANQLPCNLRDCAVAT